MVPEIQLGEKRRHDLHLWQSIRAPRPAARYCLMRKMQRVQEPPSTSFRSTSRNEGWVEHDVEDIWSSTRVLTVCREVMQTRLRGIRRTHRRDRNHQPARNHRCLGQDHRQSHPQRHRLAGPPHRRYLRPLLRRPVARRRSDRPAPGCCSTRIFRAPRCKWLLDTVARRARTGRGRRVAVRYYRQLPDLAPDGRTQPCDRRHQRRAHLCCSTSTKGEWSAEICDLLDVPLTMLPEVHDCASDFGTTSDLFGTAISRSSGVAGDQQAATIGQACFEPGMMKSTYGTGCFALLNTGAQRRSNPRTAC